MLPECQKTNTIFEISVSNCIIKNAWSETWRQNLKGVTLLTTDQCPGCRPSGGLSIGVPGSVPGYWAAHQRFGRLPWRALFQPAISLCRYGVPVSHTVHKALNNARVQRVLRNESFHLG